MDHYTTLHTSAATRYSGYAMLTVAAEMQGAKRNTLGAFQTIVLSDTPVTSNDTLALRYSVEVIRAITPLKPSMQVVLPNPIVTTTWPIQGC